MALIINPSKWDVRFLELARAISTWSKDTTKVGAIIVETDTNRIVSLGYNGFPRFMKDAAELIEDRSTKYELTIHAEMNAILFANRSLKGCTLYTHPFICCNRCATVVAQVGISRVIAATGTRLSDTFDPAFRWTTKIFDETGIEYGWIA